MNIRLDLTGDLSSESVVCKNILSYMTRALGSFSLVPRHPGRENAYIVPLAHTCSLFPNIQKKMDIFAISPYTQHHLYSCTLVDPLYTMGKALEENKVRFSATLHYALEKVGNPDMRLKKEQVASIHSVFNGNDVFVWLPTGFGKSML